MKMKKIIVFLMIAYSSSLLAQQSAYVYGDSILLSIPEYVQNMFLYPHKKSS